MSTEESKRRLVDDMILSRIESSGETEAEAIRKLLAQIADLPDDTSMIVAPGAERVDARTIRLWASFYRTPETKQ